MDDFLKKQSIRLRKRIAYANSIVASTGVTAPLKVRVLPSLIRALHKIHQGRYHDCDSCGSSISRKRLELIPGALRCIECQAKKEQL